MLVAKGSFVATIEKAGLADFDRIVICVPTPLMRSDLSLVEATSNVQRLPVQRLCNAIEREGMIGGACLGAAGFRLGASRQDDEGRV